MAKWIGPGVFRHDGKEYGYGDDLPELDKKTVGRFAKLGYIGEIPVPVLVEDPLLKEIAVKDEHIGELEDKVKNLESQLKEATTKTGKAKK